MCICTVIREASFYTPIAASLNKYKEDALWKAEMDTGYIICQPQK